MRIIYNNFSMATLTEVSYFARRGIKWGAVGLVIVMIAPIIFRGIKSLYLALRPPPPPPPTVRYGRLPKLEFPNTMEGDKPTLRLETIEGNLPGLPTIGRVYVVEINKSRLLELDRIRARVRTLGFINEPEKIDEQTFKFVHPTLPVEITFNIISNSFVYKYDWALDQSLYSATAVPNKEQAILEAKNFLQNLGSLAQDLAVGEAMHTYFAAQPPVMIPTVSLSEANFVRIDLFRAKKDDLRFVTTGGDTSPVNVVFSGSTDRGKRVVEANYAYSRVLDEDFSTYPLKTVEQAWNELQQGGGYIAREAGNQITVRKASLGYYESGTPQEFIQPVFVFEGDGGFMAYVPAVTPEYQQ